MFVIFVKLHKLCIYNHILSIMHSCDRRSFDWTPGHRGEREGWSLGEMECRCRDAGSLVSGSRVTSLQYSCSRDSNRSLVGVSVFCETMKKLGSCDICDGSVLSERGVVCGYCGEVVHFRCAGNILFIIY